MFKDYLAANYLIKSNAYLNSLKSIDAEIFKKTIIDLRALKFGRMVAKKLKSFDINVFSIWIDRSKDTSMAPGKFINISCVFFIESKISSKTFNSAVAEIVSKPPLSWFGVASLFDFVSSAKKFHSIIPPSAFIYTMTNTHSHRGVVSDVPPTSNGHIYSSIEVSVNEEIYKGLK